jgi:hypothetical protein
LSADYKRVFTPEVKAAVAAAKPDDLFTHDQGVMIGNGEIGMNEIGGSMKIITLITRGNRFGSHAPSDFRLPHLGS